MPIARLILSTAAVAISKTRLIAGSNLAPNVWDRVVTVSFKVLNRPVNVSL